MAVPIIPIAIAAVSVVQGILGGSAAKKAAKKQAAVAKVQGSINSLTQQLNSEFEAFQVDQQQTAARMGLFLTENNIDINEEFIDFTRQSTELNARLALTNADTEATVAEFNSELALQDKERTAAEGSKDVENAILSRNREVENITAKFGASGVSLDSATVSDVGFSIASEFGNEIDRIRWLSGVAQGRSLEKSDQFDEDAVRALIKGDLDASQIRLAGAFQLFSQEQRGFELGAQKISSEENVKNLEFVADSIRKFGVANASATIAGSIATAEGLQAQGNLVATQSVVGGVAKGASTAIRSLE